MRTRTLCLALLMLAGVLLPAVGCGSGTTDPVGGARPAPVTFVLPFLPAGAGATHFLGLKNLYNAPAPVWVSAYTPAGVAYNVDGLPAPGIQPLILTVPANGELRVPLSTVTGAASLGGWLQVETRNAHVLSPVTGEPSPTLSSGFVIPYLSRATTGLGIDADSLSGVTWRSAGVNVAVTPNTDTIQLVNASYNQGAGATVPVAVTFSVSTFDTAGTLLSTVLVPVPGNGSASFAPTVAVGSVRIAPGATVPGAPVPPLLQVINYAAMARENGLQQHVEHRYHETSLAHLSAQIEMGFEVEFGTDADGNLHDFEMLMSNPTATDVTLQLVAVYLEGDLPLLTTPRAFVLDAGRTVLMRTQTVDSLGLTLGEVSLFDDLFGDVFTSTGFRRATLYFQVPATIDVSVRQLDPAFFSFYRVVRAFPRSNNVCVFDLPIQETLLTGLRNTISITNPTNSAVTVPVEGFTPGGTRYLLDAITVGPRSRLDWTPDGMIFREDPSDLLGPPVAFMRFQFFPNVGLFFRGRVVRTDLPGVILFERPHILRDN